MGDRLGTPGAAGNLFSFSFFFSFFLFQTPWPRQLPFSVRSVCSSFMLVTFCRFSFCFCFSQCLVFLSSFYSFLIYFLFFLLFFIDSVFNLRTTADMTDTVVFGKLFSYFFFAPKIRPNISALVKTSVKHQFTLLCPLNFILWSFLLFK